MTVCEIALSSAVFPDTATLVASHAPWAEVHMPSRGPRLALRGLDLPLQPHPALPAPTSAPATPPLTALSRAVSLATQAVFLCPEPSFLPLPWFLLYVLGAPYSILEAAVINDPRLGGLKQQKPILLQVPRPEAQCHGDGGLVPPSWTL